MRLSLFTLLSTTLLLTLLLSGCAKKYQIISSTKDGNDIVFNIAHGGQKIKGTCNATGTPCQDLALRVGQPVDCYLNPNHPEPYEYGKHLPLNFPAGLVCHVRQGKGEYFVMHLRDCVDLRKIDAPDVVLHKTKSKDWEQSIGKTFSSITIKCTRVSGCNDSDSSVASLHRNYGEFEALRGVATSFSLLEKEAQQPNSAFIVVWHPAKIWISRSLSDADEMKETEDKLESDDGSTANHRQFFDKDGVLLPHEFGDYYQNGDKPQFCRDRSDKFFNTRGKEVEDDTAFLDVKEIK